MKFDCGKTIDEMKDWHPWFAWHPVRVGPHDCRWLETIERRLWGFTVEDSWYIWEYRA